MKVHIEREQTIKEIEFCGTVQELLKTLQINPETVLVTKDDTVLTCDENIENKDTLHILSVISGG